MKGWSDMSEQRDGVIKKQAPSQMAEAIGARKAGRIAELAASGEVLNTGENAIALLVHGVDPEGPRAPGTAGSGGIEMTLRAARAAGVDLEAPIDGEPPAHYVTRHYMGALAPRYFEESQATIFGQEEVEEVKHLKAFARGGVDFTERNAQGESATSFGRGLVEDYALKHHPECMEGEYELSHVWDTPPYWQVAAAAAHDLGKVKSLSVRHKVSQQANQAEQVQTGAAQAASGNAQRKTNQDQLQAE